MSGQNARAHTSQSNRARARETIERKTVVKSVVHNPFQVQWPSVPVNIQNAILASVVDMLEGVSEYYLGREQGSMKKRSRATHGGRSHKRKKARSEHIQGQGDPVSMETEASMPTLTNEPPVLQSMTVGINETTRRLEEIAHSHRSIFHISPQSAALGPPPSPPTGSRVVIACRGDVDPPLLIGHLPNLVAACNSARRSADSPIQGTWLVPMSKGTEVILAEAMGLRRVSVLLLESTAPQYSSLASLLESVPLLHAPWLSFTSPESPLALVPTHIKQTRTTAPKDMKAAKERRLKERAEAKERRRSHRKSVGKRITVTAEDKHLT